MCVKNYSYLPQEAIYIRKTVFMEEQGFSNEFDKTDEDSIHMVLYSKTNPIGTCRVYNSNTHNGYVIGRLAITKAYRGMNCGTELIIFAEDIIKKQKGHRVGLSAQENAKGFYEKLGYHPQGEPYLDEGCSHIWMQKEL